MHLILKGRDLLSAVRQREHRKLHAAALRQFYGADRYEAVDGRLASDDAAVLISCTEKTCNLRSVVV